MAAPESQCIPLTYLVADCAQQSYRSTRMSPALRQHSPSWRRDTNTPLEPVGSSHRLQYLSRPTGEQLRGVLHDRRPISRTYPFHDREM